MDYTSFEMPKKSIKDTFLQKFLLISGADDSKERLNTENLSNFALSHYLDTETSKANGKSNTESEKQTTKPQNKKPPIYHSNKNFIDLTNEIQVMSLK